MKTAMINTLKKINRTVLEMDLGILLLGVSAQIIGAFIAKDEAMYAKSLWFGVLLALVSTYHMYRSLDRALDQPEKTATKMIIRAYVLRYVMLIFFLFGMNVMSSNLEKMAGGKLEQLLKTIFHLCYMYESNGISTAAYP